ncbi:hypothetical protein SCP_1601010 [Sparassis crispa]|uniref:BTB domain-containing protein n=1 Tax=Sparassis crispa TaxID=139825 RepID=A0A401H4Y5_9APHY|nr:hypothetical protein SCP_1601010 [Sparassis crispa]GBE89439.1 hypothetical protein SCP_1601010 [Sparassis crispa]
MAALPDLSHTSRIDPLWFEDGNVVLIAGERTCRVHRGILSRYSTVFSDLFTIPQPSDAPMLHGASIVTLSDDPQHLEYTLRALYDIDYLDNLASIYDIWYDHEIYPILIGVASLAHKYNIPPLLRRAVSRLKTAFSSTFEELKTRSGFYCSRTENLVDPKLHPSTKPIITLARRIHPSELDSVLPIAFYMYSQSDTESLLEDALRSGQGSDEWDVSVEDIRFFLPVATNLSRDCITKQSCLSTLTELTRSANRLELCTSRNPLRDMDEWFDSMDGLCDECLDRLKTRHRKERVRIWSNLGHTFKLDDRSGENRLSQGYT